MRFSHLIWPDASQDDDLLEGREFLMPLFGQSLLMGLNTVIVFLPLSHMTLEMGTNSLETTRDINKPFHY